jgi:8-oxo-dGTP diphosphatase
VGYCCNHRKFKEAADTPIANGLLQLSGLSNKARIAPFSPSYDEIMEHYTPQIEKENGVVSAQAIKSILDEIDRGRKNALDLLQEFAQYRKVRKRNGFRKLSYPDFEEYGRIKEQAFNYWKNIIPTLRKRLIVTCAIIEKDREAMAAQRSANMSHPLRWEFPGGKQIGTEPLEQCIRRELMEEFDIKVKVKTELRVVEYAYPDFDIVLVPFVCELKSKNIVVKEHKQIGWFTPGSLRNVNWSEADVEVVEIYGAYCGAR